MRTQSAKRLSSTIFATLMLSSHRDGLQDLACGYACPAEASQHGCPLNSRPLDQLAAWLFSSAHWKNNRTHCSTLAAECNAGNLLASCNRLLMSRIHLHIPGRGRRTACGVLAMTAGAIYC